MYIIKSKVSIFTLFLTITRTSFNLWSVVVKYFSIYFSPTKSELLKILCSQHVCRFTLRFTSIFVYYSILCWGPSIQGRFHPYLKDLPLESPFVEDPFFQFLLPESIYTAFSGRVKIPGFSSCFPCGMQDLNSLTSGWTHAPCSGARGLNHWTSGRSCQLRSFRTLKVFDFVSWLPLLQFRSWPSVWLLFLCRPPVFFSLIVSFHSSVSSVS